jgi:hypothetical protein
MMDCRNLERPVSETPGLEPRPAGLSSPGESPRQGTTIHGDRYRVPRTGDVPGDRPRLPEGHILIDAPLGATPVDPAPDDNR